MTTKKTTPKKAPKKVEPAKEKPAQTQEQEVVTQDPRNPEVKKYPGGTQIKIH